MTEATIINITTDRQKKQSKLHYIKKGSSHKENFPLYSTFVLPQTQRLYGQRYNKEFSRSADFQTNNQNASTRAV